MPRSQSGLYVESVDDVVAKVKKLQEDVNEYTSQLNQFLKDINDLKDLGTNIEKIKPVLESMQKDVNAMAKQSESTINVMKGHMVDVMKAENKKIDLS